MATITPLYSTTTALTVTGLATLASTSSAVSATIDNTAGLWTEIAVEVTITTGASAVANGYLEIRAKASIDNTDFDDNANDRWVGSIVLPVAAGQTLKKIVYVAAAFGGIAPPYVQIRVYNATGAALTAGAASYRGYKLQSA